MSRRDDAQSVVRIGTFVLALGTLAMACGIFSREGPPPGATIVRVVANTSLTPWLEGVVEQFNDSDPETAAGDPIYIELSSTESGQAVADLSSAGRLPAIWIPDQRVWVDILAEEGFSEFADDCVGVAESPLVIAMWRPVAEALGWPGRAIGWLDVGSLAADPSAWDYYSGGQFGSRLRLGHTHPGLSGSGAGTLLAVVQAAQSMTAAVTTEDIDSPIVQASVGAFEGAVSWFSDSTASLAQRMAERGVEFLGAGIMYESSVVQYGGGDPDIVPIYPFEGTFVADHPACINADLDPLLQEASLQFRGALLAESAQRAALDSGLRPVHPAVALGPPLDGARGIDVAEPRQVFESPSVESVYAIQELWQAARKDVNLVMLLDVSGSMRGGKIESVRQAASQFVSQMGDDDRITLLTFSTVPSILVHNQQVALARDDVIATINGLQADGETALFDAIAQGANLIAEGAAPETTNAMIVLTDGLDTSSVFNRFDQGLIELASANDTTVFTIAYGTDANANLLSDLAARANGNFYRGDEVSIASIYQEMSAAFGGAVGVGR